MLSIVLSYLLCLGCLHEKNSYVIGTSTKALLKGLDTWKKETMMKNVN